LEKESTYELIDQYLNGKLSEKEKISFQNEISSNQELNALVEKQRLANQLIIENRLSKLKSQVGGDIQAGVADRLIFRKNLIHGLWWTIGLITICATTFMVLSKEEVVNHKSNQIKSVETHTQTVVPNSTTTTESTKTEKVKPSFKTDKTSVVKKDVMNQSPVEVELKKTTADQTVDQTSKNHDDTNVMVEDKKDPCSQIQLNLSGNAIATCFGRDEGKLEIDGAGGTTPYKFGIRKESSKEVSWKVPGVTSFDHLSSGKYYVIAEDKNGCKTDQEVSFIISSKSCVDEQTEEYAFKPEYGEQFKLQPENDGTISIYDRAGREVYQSTLHAGTEFIWDGMDLHGKFVEKGLYLYLLKYKEGNTKKGYITVY
jgi:hypothetical protein